MSSILRVDNLKKHFPLGGGLFSKKKGHVYAVDGVSFEIEKGATMGLVGESGSGKTTVGRCILGMIEPTDGHVFFEDKDMTGLSHRQMIPIRRHMQVIFQDPYGCLTPRMRLHSLLEEPLDVHDIGRRSERKAMVAAVLKKVGLRPEHMTRFPHEFSGGQRQRIAIARALMLNPKLIIADEPVSALDVSIQAQIINLMVRLQKEFKLTYLLISHDLSVVKYMADRIAVMYLGKIVELSSQEDLYANPLHPYTDALLSAIPVPRVNSGREKVVLGGEVPSPINPPSGCPFHPRCSLKVDDCHKAVPELRDMGNGHSVACHLRRG